MTIATAKDIINRNQHFGSAEKKSLREVVDAVYTGITPGAAITDASEAHALNAVFSDVEVEGALDALGAKINAVIAALEAAGIIST